jgi:hypothetical protein
MMLQVRPVQEYTLENTSGLIHKSNEIFERILLLENKKNYNERNCGF